jgi:heme A synthase
MNWFKIASVLLLLGGLVLLVIGLAILNFLTEVPAWNTVIIIIGLLFMLGAVVMLCLALQYD